MCTSSLTCLLNWPGLRNKCVSTVQKRDWFLPDIEIKRNEKITTA